MATRKRDSLSSTWRTVRFGDVVRNVNAVEHKPLENGIEHFVGLEHLDPGSLHIKRWGLVADGTMFTRKFTRGQVLFGKRRAYQHKAAVAEFDGICSGDILVFEPANDELLLELLPFIVQSDGFFERALGTSAGSLSPRTKWKDLAEYEFALPPLNEQRRIAELLRAADEAVENFIKLGDTLTKFQNTRIDEFIERGVPNQPLKRQSVPTKFQTERVLLDIPESWRCVRLADVIESAQSGFASGERDEDGVVQLRMNNVSRECRIVWDDITRVPVINDLDTFTLQVDNVLFNNTNSEDLVGKTAYFEGYSERVVFSNHFTRLIPQQELLPKYLAVWLQSNYRMGLFAKRCQRWVGQAAVQRDNLLSLEMLLPPIEEQKLLIAGVNVTEQAMRKNAEHIEVLQSVKKVLLQDLVR